MLLKSSLVQFSELEEILHHLPEGISGLSHESALKLWQQWCQQGSVQMGRVDLLRADGSRELQALGISLWISDKAIQALARGTHQSCTHRVYAAASQSLQWVMETAEIERAHEKGELNLMVLHFWSAVAVTSQAFQSVFLQTSAQFKDIHQGFGIQRVVQEVSTAQMPFLAASGLRVVHQVAHDKMPSMVWMEISADDARAHPGTTMSFLFFSPPRRLKLKPAAQRMLLLALRQLTDEDIATVLGCSRDYVRKLWTDAYMCLQYAGAGIADDATCAQSSDNGSAKPTRGRERRRAALEFLRANPHELRPGLPGKLLT